MAQHSATAGSAPMRGENGVEHLAARAGERDIQCDKTRGKTKQKGGERVKEREKKSAREKSVVQHSASAGSAPMRGANGVEHLAARAGERDLKCQRARGR